MKVEAPSELRKLDAMRPLDYLIAAVGLTAPVALFVAAAGKVLAGQGVVLPLGSWDYEFGASYTGVVLISLAEAVPLGLVLARRWIAANRWGAALLVPFLALSVANLVYSDEPHCRCYGLWAEYWSAMGDAKLGVFRDIALLAASLAFLTLRGLRQRKAVV